MWKSSILKIYILKEFIKIFFLGLIAFTAFYIIIDFFEILDDLIEHKASLWLGLRYFLYKTPLILFQLTPAGILLSTLLTLGIFLKNNEITAMKACGISLYQMINPIILFSLLVTIVSIINNEFLLPYFVGKVELVKNIEIKAKPIRLFFKEKEIWYRSSNNIFEINFFNPNLNQLMGVTIYQFDKDFNLLKRSDAEQAIWMGGVWYFYNMIIRTFQPNGEVKVERHPLKIMDMAETPEVFKRVEKTAEEMNSFELRRYIKRLQQEGYDTTKYRVDLHRKIAYPFSNAIMVLLGIPFALTARRKGGISLGIVMSFAIGLSYWILFSISISLGHAGTLPPLLSSWMAHIIFILFGLLMIISRKS